MDDSDVLATYNARRQSGGTSSSNNDVLASYSGRPAKRVEDRLLEIQRQYLERVAMRRQAQEERDEQGFTGAPAINKRSKDLAGNRSRQATFERLAAPPSPPRPPPAAAVAHEHKPSINKESARLQRTVEAQFEWERNRNMKLEAKRAEMECRDAGSATFAPLLDPKSRAIASLTRPADAHVEDVLLSKGRDIDEKLEAERRRIVRESKTTKVVLSESTNAVADATDRLYHDAQERLRVAEEAARVQELLRVVDSDGHILFRPAINKNGSVDLSNRGEDLFAHLSRSSRAAPPPPEPADCHKPTIGTYSVLLAKLRNVDSTESVVERLAKPKPVPDHRAASPKLSFHPAINKRSEHLDAHSNAMTGECASRAELLLQRQRLYDAHRERLLREKENNELSQTKITPRRTKTPTKFFERSQAWAQRNEARLQAQREAKKDVDLEGCTFKPQTRH